MSTEAFKAALEQARLQWNAGNLGGYLQLYDGDVALHGYAGVEPGFGGVRKFYEAFFTAFPGSQLIFEDVFGAGDRIACRFVVKGAHLGPFQGLPPSGKRFELPGITVLRFSGDKCVERWSQSDFLGLLGQLGMLPAPG
jgi:predicted ester cyclase